VLYIEASQMFGKKGLTLTGQLGDVMKESAQTALSWVRSHARQLGIEDSFFERVDLHLHVPEGAIPRTGPSARASRSRPGDRVSAATRPAPCGLAPSR
jgi:ATP-dependent Lon protease